jgi:hypothetical protein
MSNRSATGQVKLDIQATIVNTMDDGQTASYSIGESPISGRLTSGVSEDEFNRAWADFDRTILSAATEDLDLYDLGSLDIGAGAGADALGQAMTFEEIVALVIVQTGGTGRLEINPTDPSNKLAWVPTLTVANGGALRIGATLAMVNKNTDAFPVTDASSHMIRLGANGGTAIYDIYVLGRHDDEESSSSSTSSSSLSASSASSSSTSSLSSSSTSSLSTTSTSSGSSSSSSHSISSSSTLSSSTLSSSTLSSSSSSGP